MKFPEEVLAKKLKDKNLKSVYFRKKVNLCYLANLYYKGYIPTEQRKKGKVWTTNLGIEILYGKGRKEGNVIKKSGSILDFPRLKGKIVIIDRFRNLLKEEEIKSLNRQINFSRFYTKSLYWENYLVISNQMDWDGYLLDPYAEKRLERVDPNRKYLLLGIVDKGNRLKGITAKIGEEYGLKRFRIDLKGKLLGVPTSIDRIVLVLLLTLRGFSIEDSILLASPKRFLLQRLRSELNKKEKDFDFIRKLEKLINIDRDNFIFKLKLDELKEILKKI